jgi:hypothetical protein
MRLYINGLVAIAKKKETINHQTYFTSKLCAFHGLITRLLGSLKDHDSFLCFFCVFFKSRQYTSICLERFDIHFSQYFKRNFMCCFY